MLASRSLPQPTSNTESPPCSAPGLSTAHICTLTAYRGANYVNLRPLDGPGYSNGGGGPRGDIREFSWASRGRLMTLTNTINRGKIGVPYFITLTYPSSWPPSARTWKAHLRALRERMIRRYGRFPAIWRLEFQKRGAPHFHLLAWAEIPASVVDPDIKEAFLSGRLTKEKALLRQLQLDISTWWYEVVGSGDPRHLSAGTRCELPRSWRAVNFYVSKYVAKPEKLQAGVESPGRFWGLWYRDLLPIDPVESSLTWEQFFKARRVLHRYSGRRSHRSRIQSVGCFVGFGTSNRLLAWLGIIGSSPGSQHT